jgi:hypothetical protein
MPAVPRVTALQPAPRRCPHRAAIKPNGPPTHRASTQHATAHRPYVGPAHAADAPAHPTHALPASPPAPPLPPAVSLDPTLCSVATRSPDERLRSAASTHAPSSPAAAHARPTSPLIALIASSSHAKNADYPRRLLERHVLPEARSVRRGRRRRISMKEFERWLTDEAPRPMPWVFRNRAPEWSVGAPCLPPLWKRRRECPST